MHSEEERYVYFRALFFRDEKQELTGTYLQRVLKGTYGDTWRRRELTRYDIGHTDARYFQFTA